MVRKGRRRSSSRGVGGRRRKKTSGKVKKDRISDLPDELIDHILSYVHSDVAVQTMVLSKRWVNLWTTLTSFNLQLFGARKNSKKISSKIEIISLLSQNLKLIVASQGKLG